MSEANRAKRTVMRVVVRRLLGGLGLLVGVRVADRNAPERI